MGNDSLRKVIQERMAAFLEGLRIAAARDRTRYPLEQDALDAKLDEVLLKEVWRFLDTLHDPNDKHEFRVRVRIAMRMLKEQMEAEKGE